MRQAGVVLICCVLVAAPIAAGGVHRIPSLALLALSGLATALFGVGLWLERRVPRVGFVALVPLVFLVIPALQSIPLPRPLRGALDPQGNALLAENPVLAPSAVAPLSLDPPSTRVQVGRAAAALAVFLLAFHLASGHRHRHLLPRLVGLTGIAAAAIGLGHRVFGVVKIYGVLGTTESLLRGPFVNKNHNAEFLELAAFACLACSLQRASALNRVGWMVGVVLCAVGTVGTFSRGGAVALAAGALLFLFLRQRTGHDEAAAEGPERRFWPWALLVGALVVLTAGALGAGRLVERLQQTGINTDVRLALWKDSLRVLQAHPLGIGRGAFGEVYPIYRTLLVLFPLRFSFAENQPLQLLIESGWLLYFGVVAGMAFLVRTVVKHGRGDAVEAAFLAGLFAVLAHNLVDFGLETLGVLLPFMAMLGWVLGRSRAAETEILPRRPSWGIVGVALGALVFGAGAVAHASNDDFDAKLRVTTAAGPRRALLERAQQAHPVDYFYALSAARSEPLVPAVRGGASPRLHALNHALTLCPSCELVHSEVARSLWALSLHSQALLEWRTVVHIAPALFDPVLRELTRSGAKADELASFAAFDGQRLIQVATFLADSNRVADAFVALDQADALEGATPASLVARGRLQVRANQLDAAQATLARAHALQIQDPRVVVLDAEVTLGKQGAAGADAALAILDAGAARYPQDVDIQRVRVKTVLDYQRWQAAPRAVEGLQRVLYATQGNAVEAHIAGARIQSKLGHWTAALGAYRIALADAPADAGLWLELGQTAESAGRDATAREAYAEAARLSPSAPQVQAAIRRVDERQARTRAAASNGPRAAEGTR
jgi:tetratricopeptide (TPR) repeat protein